MIALILLVAAAVCFGLAAFGVGGRVNVVALGLLFWVAAVIVERIS